MNRLEADHNGDENFSFAAIAGLRRWQRQRRRSSSSSTDRGDNTHRFPRSITRSPDENRRSSNAMWRWHIEVLWLSLSCTDPAKADAKHYDDESDVGGDAAPATGVGEAADAAPPPAMEIVMG